MSVGSCLLPGPYAASLIHDPHLVRLISIILYCTLTKPPDLVRHVGTCAGLLLQEKLWLISFNPRPRTRSQRNAESKCKNANAPSLLLSYINSCGCSYSILLIMETPHKGSLASETSQVDVAGSALTKLGLVGAVCFEG